MPVRFDSIAVALVLALMASLLLFGKVCAQTDKQIIIENADSLVARVIDGENARELISNVRFSQGKVRVTCNRAVQFIQSGNIQLLGNVRIVDDSVTMLFPRGMYLREERRAVAYDSVRLDDRNVVLTARFGEYHMEPKKAFFKSDVVATERDSRLTSDSLIYFRTEQRTIALGNVEIQSFPDGLTIRGGHFESIKKEEYSRMTEHPVLVKFDTSSASARIDTLVVRSRIMESYRGDSVKKLIATDSVEILRADLASVAGLALFYTQGDSIRLRKAPVVWYQHTQVSGDSIDVYLKSRKLDVVHVMGNCFTVSRSDSMRKDKFDQITGDEMTMKFGEKALERMEVNTQAISVYHLYDDTTANGLNKTSGDRIVMLWEDQKLSSIRVYGGVEGQYFPENLTYGKETEFELGGFLWREDKPMLRKTDFHPNPKQSTKADK